MCWSENKNGLLFSSAVNPNHSLRFLHIMHRLQRQIIHLVFCDASFMQVCTQQFILLFQFLAAPLQQFDVAFNSICILQSFCHFLLRCLQVAYVITGLGKDNTFTLQQEKYLFMLRCLPNLQR